MDQESADTNPLESFWSQQDHEIDWAEHQSQIQELMYSCVRAEGFTYVVGDEPKSDQVVLSLTPENVSEIGLGISTRYFDSEFVGTGLSGAPPGSGEDPNRRPSPSANAEYAGTLNPDEREQFLSTIDVCETEALSQLDSARAALLSDEELLNEAVSDMFQRYEADPSVEAEHLRIETCMASLGYEFSSVQETSTSIRRRIEREILPLFEQHEAEASAHTSVEFVSEAAIVLGEIQSEEIEIARALSECGGLESQLPSELRTLRQMLAEQVFAEYYG